MSEFIDISVSMNPGMVVWPTSERWEVQRMRSFEDGDDHTVSVVRADVHAGTHVDAPLHFVQGGAAVDTLPLDTFVGDCRIVDCGEAELVTADHVQRADGAKRILFRTRNSSVPHARRSAFDSNFAALGVEAASAVAKSGAVLVGIDYLSIQRYNDPTSDVHTTLLRAGVAILEGLDLHNISEGHYELFAAPVKFAGCEAAPVRAFLRKVN